MTDEERKEMRRQLEIVFEGLDSRMGLVAEGVAMTNERLERFEDQTARQLEAVRVEAQAFRAEFHAFRTETARNFADVRTEAKAFRAETASNFADVREEAEAFRTETAHNFADARVEVAGTFSDVDRRLRAVENR